VLPYKEEWADEALKKETVVFASIPEVVQHSEVIFVPIQTPHEERYEGITRIPQERVDFNYEWLKAGMKSLCDEINRQQKHITVIIISTVLPGTVEREIIPLLNNYVHLCYNPFFIAMGTTMRDFENPEFVLLGCDDNTVVDQVKRLYSTIHQRPVYHTTIKNAELIKVVYNTYISSKIAFINTIMEVCHKTGANVDAVTEALSLATDRVISPKYMRGGMGDGGGCHPRDNIALSWLARKLNLSYDYFEHIMMARERQTEWLADLIEDQYKKTSLPITLLGVAFKPETNLIVGSPALLLSNLLRERDLPHKIYDPCVYGGDVELQPGIYFISTQHEIFKSYDFPAGSVVIDPFGYMPDRNGVTVIRIGRN
jgi:UDPglucose 6-dehydrogenase